MSDRTYYAYKVTNLSTGRNYYVNADHLVDLTQVWRSQMDFFMPGTRVQIEGQFGKSRIFVEMICDWWAFSWKSGNLYEIFGWWDEHKEYMTLSPRTRNTVEAILAALKDTLDEMKEAKDGKAEKA